MEKPKCPLCGFPHYSYEPHVFKDDRKPVKTKEPIVKTKVLTVKTKPVKTKESGLTNAERQRKWQREHRDEFNRIRRERYKAKVAKTKAK